MQITVSLFLCADIDKNCELVYLCHLMGFLLREAED